MKINNENEYQKAMNKIDKLLTKEDKKSVSRLKKLAKVIEAYEATENLQKENYFVDAT